MTAFATESRVLRIGTRGSALALAQAREAAGALGGAHRNELVPMTTKGDATSRRLPSGSWVDDDGQFTRDLERALADGRVDAVVHSYKDLPIEPVDGLVIGAVLERADPSDCLVTDDGRRLDELPAGARVGTSSPRRAAQLRATRDDLTIMPMRGNVETRLARLRAGEFDAIVLAAAGLERLCVPVADAWRLSYDVMLPAAAQGAIAIQVRAHDGALAAELERVEHRPTRIAVEAERALLRAIGGGCLAPLGTLGEVADDRLYLRVAYAREDGSLVRAQATGDVAEAPAVVAKLAREVLGR